MPRYASYSDEYLLDYLRSAEDTQKIAWSVAYMAEHATMPKSTIKRAIARLIRNGRLAIVSPGVPSARTPNVYRIVKTEADK